MIVDSIRKIIRKENLSEQEMTEVMLEVIHGKAAPSQVGTLLAALRMKGETIEEITGAVKALRSRIQTLDFDFPILSYDRDDINVEDETILEISGSRYNGTSIFNISTATIFVVAAAGVRIARYGSRKNPSYFGASDVLEHLGVKLDLTRSDIENCIREIGIGFIFTPLFQSPMQFVAGVREEIGVRSIFNLIGPLINPVSASSHIMGVYDHHLTDVMAHVLKNIGTQTAIVLCGAETFDEISICGPSRISHLKDGQITHQTIEPEDFGFRRSNRDAIRGGNAVENALIIRKVLDGESGPQRNIVILNAAAGFVAAGLTHDMKQGAQLAAEMIDSKKAKRKLDDLAAFTLKCGHFFRKEL